MTDQTTDPTPTEVCDDCGQPITPMESSGSGYRHKPGGHWCDSKPPRPKTQEV